MVNSIYVTARVYIRGQRSQAFKMNNDMKKGKISKLTKEICSSRNQARSLSSTLFNAVITEIVYHFERMLVQQNKTAKQYNLKLSISKTMSMGVAKNPVRCKLMVKEETILQVRNFKYIFESEQNQQKRDRESTNTSNEGSNEGSINIGTIARYNMTEQVHEAREQNQDIQNVRFMT